MWASRASASTSSGCAYSRSMRSRTRRRRTRSRRCWSLLTDRDRKDVRMAKTDATTIEAGGRELRVSSPDRVIFPATERTGDVTKLDVVRYYLSVEEGIMRALDRKSVV